MEFEAAECRAAARRIAEMLCESAIWDAQSQTCSWISASADPLDSTLRPMSLELYGGLAGAALFLAAAHVASGDQPFRDTAIAALRAAHLKARVEPLSGADLSIFEGRFGLHAVTGQISRFFQIPTEWAVLGEVAGLVDRAAALTHSFDMMTGNAGAICGLLDFQPSEFRPHLLANAARLGEELYIKPGLRMDGSLGA